MVLNLWNLIVKKANSFKSSPPVEIESKDEEKTLTEREETNEEGKASYVLTYSHKNQMRSLATICVFMIATFVFAVFLIGSFYMFNEIANYRRNQYRIWCSIPFPESLEITQIDFTELSPPTSEGLSSDNQQSSAVMIKKGNRKLFFDEEFDIDQDHNFERIEVPEVAVAVQPCRFIFDFSMNITGIVDIKGKRCFILPLNRTYVLLPQPLREVIKKLRSGDFNIDNEYVQENYRVVIPPVEDISLIGIYIKRECGSNKIYRLVKTGHDMIKRTTDERQRVKFAVFAGRKIAGIEIVNLHVNPNSL